VRQGNDRNYFIGLSVPGSRCGSDSSEGVQCDGRAALLDEWS